jgi:histidinol-phosphatase (PHP family)
MTAEFLPPGPRPPVPVPHDGHTHSQWSWDADSGSMQGSCARAVQLGLPAIAFTEHVDAVRWAVPRDSAKTMRARGLTVDADGRFEPEPVDVDGYLASIEDCRTRFPDLRILTGAELGEPHWFPDHARALLATGAFERILGSVHSIPFDGRPWATDDLLGPSAPEGLPPHDVVRRYLAEVLRLVTADTDIAVLAHIDFPLRHWPTGRGPVGVSMFEEEFRAVLTELAGAGRALEINTRRPLEDDVVGWWAEAGGTAVTFGSDAHEPGSVGHGFERAAATAVAHGFGPGPHPHDAWVRT